MSNSKRPGGPGGPRGMRKGPKAKNPMKTLKRIFAIIVKGYPIQCVLVIIGTGSIFPADKSVPTGTHSPASS